MVVGSKNTVDKHNEGESPATIRQFKRLLNFTHIREYKSLFTEPA